MPAPRRDGRFIAVTAAYDSASGSGVVYPPITKGPGTPARGAVYLGDPGAATVVGGPPATPPRGAVWRY